MKFSHERRHSCDPCASLVCCVLLVWALRQGAAGWEGARGKGAGGPWCGVGEEAGLGEVGRRVEKGTGGPWHGGGEAGQGAGGRTGA